MTNMLGDGTAWLADQLEQHASESVTYRRPRTSGSVTLNATPETALAELIEDDQPVGEQWNYPAWLIRPGDLVLDGLAVEPEAGDRISWTKGAKVLTYEVQPMLGDAVFEYVDANRNLMRVKTILIDED